MNINNKKKWKKSMKKVAFELFAKIHPHEAYDTFPARFLKFAKELTGLKPKEIKKLLKETNTQ